MSEDLKNLSSVFEKQIFRIPDYQRGYAWQKPQLTDFWEDVLNLQEDRLHYTGLLSIKKMNKEEQKNLGSDSWLMEDDFVPYNVVDGQQRLTTFVIFINEIINLVRRIPENKGKTDSEILLGVKTLDSVIEKYLYQKQKPLNLVTTYLFGYEQGNPSSDFLRYRIFEEGTTGTLKETYYTHNLEVAKQFFKENLQALYNEDGFKGINDVYKTLTQRMMFNIHKIEDDYDVFVAFESMNNRGKKLTNLELLKNRLIYLTTIYDDKIVPAASKEYLRNEINAAWAEVYYQLGRNTNNPISDDDFLRAHWIIFFKYTRNRGDDYIKYLLEKFSAKNVFEKKSVVEVQNDVKEIRDYDKDEEEDEEELFSELKLKPSEISDYVKSLKHLAKFWYATFFPREATLSDEEKISLDRLNRLGFSFFRPLVTVALSKSDSLDDKVSLLNSIERFIFIVFRCGGARSNYHSAEFYKAAKDLYYDEISISEITNKINHVTNDDMQWAVSSFTTLIDKLAHTNNKDGYYAWGTLRYFLYEYEQSLVGNNGVKKIFWEHFDQFEKGKISVEHILPQTPTQYYWRNQFRQFSKEEIQMLTITLGNLLPLSLQINESLQNDSFEEKKNPQKEGRRGYAKGSYSELEVAQNNDWTAFSIQERGYTLLQFMEKRWNLVFSEEQKKQLLFIDFVNDGRIIPEELEKPNIEISDEVVSTESNAELRVKYWEFALPKIVEAFGGNGSYSNVKPSSDTALDGSFGLSNIHLFNQIMKNGSKTGLWMNSQDNKLCKTIFDFLYSHKEEFEKNINMPITWDRKKDDTCACCIYVSTTDSYLKVEDWASLSSFQVFISKAMYDCVSPYMDDIRALSS